MRCQNSEKKHCLWPEGASQGGSRKNGAVKSTNTFALSGEGSRKRKITKDFSNDDLLGALDCPVCQDAPLTGHIYQCLNGHLLVNNEIKNSHDVDPCFSMRSLPRLHALCCRTPKVSYVSTALALPPPRSLVSERMREVVVSVVSKPCPNATFGCSFTAKEAETLRQHQENCRFKRVILPGKP